MKVFSVLFLMFTLAFSKVYYSKVQPYGVRDISSNVSGLVVFIDENMIGEKLTSKAYLRIDSELDSVELVFLKEKLEYMLDIIKANKDILANLEKSLSRKRDNYGRIEDLKFKSIVEKDKEYYDLLSSENLYLNTQKEIQNLKVQITDLKLRESQLQRSIKDKYLSEKGFVLYEVLVKVGQVVGVSTPLAKVADTSKAILTIYLDEPDVHNAKNKVIYINGKKTSYKISRSLNIADGKNISKYMAQIVISSPKLFSKLVTIELKDK